MASKNQQKPVSELERKYRRRLDETVSSDSADYGYENNENYHQQNATGNNQWKQKGHHYKGNVAGSSGSKGQHDEFYDYSKKPSAQQDRNMPQKNYSSYQQQDYQYKNKYQQQQHLDKDSSSFGSHKKDKYHDDFEQYSQQNQNQQQQQTQKYKKKEKLEQQQPVDQAPRQVVYNKKGQQQEQQSDKQQPYYEKKKKDHGGERDKQQQNWKEQQPSQSNKVYLPKSKVQEGGGPFNKNAPEFKILSRADPVPQNLSDSKQAQSLTQAEQALNKLKLESTEFKPQAKQYNPQAQEFKPAPKQQQQQPNLKLESESFVPIKASPQQPLHLNKQAQEFVPGSKKQESSSKNVAFNPNSSSFVPQGKNNNQYS